MTTTADATSVSGDGPVVATPARGGAGDAGMTTAEYAIGTVAACGFAALLFRIVTSDTVAELLMGLVRHALSLAS